MKVSHPEPVLLPVHKGLSFCISSIFSSIRSPGYGLLLVSESNEGVVHAAEGISHATTMSSHRGSGGQSDTHTSVTLPEDIGRETAVRLVEEIVRVSGMCSCSLVWYNTLLVPCREGV